MALQCGGSTWEHRQFGDPQGKIDSSKEIQMLKRLSMAGAVLLTLSAIAPLRAEIIEQVVVKVNGDIITKTEFEQRQVSELRNRPELGNASPNSIELQKAVGEVTPDLILSAVDELLLVQRG